MGIINGAGATCLSCAAFLGKDYRILEAESEIGGYCKTIRKDGFVWDYSGHFFHFRNPAIGSYVKQYIPRQALLDCHKHTQIKYKDRYIDYPFQKNIHQLNQPEFIDCLYDLFCNPYIEYENFEEMLYCKFGKSIAQKFLIPYNEKLYACPLNRLDPDAMGRFFPYADKTDIIANFKKHDNQSYNDTFTYPLGGAIEYIHSLLQRVDSASIQTSCPVNRIDPARKIVFTPKGNLTYDHLISTIPFPILLDLCGMKYDPTVYSWNKVLVFNLGFDIKGPDAVNHWIYFPDKALSFYRVGHYDNIFQTDRMSLYVELGFAKDADIDVEKWFTRVLTDLQTAGVVNTQKLISSHHVIMDPAYVHITQHSISDVQRKKEELASLDIYSIGRYGSWTYYSIEDGIIEALELCQALYGKTGAELVANT